ncbi:hypothetical protein GCM10011309_08230 [Litorimonas cladophorae]|uniref:Uncharacterized protein n=1 Tax=Litorimonas cladophorae TaxID=1220491 RepID=A0A918NDW2_9PROT|nr:hypothetical protein GCM10011309_08230 [Litorimonas cladophorae]
MADIKPDMFSKPPFWILYDGDPYKFGQTFKWINPVAKKICLSGFFLAFPIFPTVWYSISNDLTFFTVVTVSYFGLCLTPIIYANLRKTGYISDDQPPH